METMSPSTVTPPPPMTAEEKKLARKAKLVEALGALDARGSGSKKQPTAVKTEASAQAPVNSATTSSTPTPTPKAPAAPKFPRKQLPVDDRFGLPLSPRFLEATPREPSTFGRATRM